LARTVERIEGEDSVGVQGKIQRVFGLENHQEFEFESGKSR